MPFVRRQATCTVLRTSPEAAAGRRSRGRLQAVTETLERRQLLAATSVGLAIDSEFGFDVGRAFAGIEGIGPSASETYDLAVLLSGNTLVAGGGGVVRLAADGLRDPAFGSNGYVDSPRPPGGRWTWWNALLPLADERVLVGGTLLDPEDASWRMPLLARYTGTGFSDAAFGPAAAPDSGVVYLPFTHSTSPDADGGSVLDLAALPDGSYLAGGFVRTDDRPADPQDLAVWRIRADGTLDTSFGDGGLRVHHLAEGAEAVTAVVVRDDGGFFAATTDGVVSFDAAGSVTGAVGDRAPALIAPGAGGTLVTASATGSGDVRVRRFLADGTPDSAFGGPSGALIDFDGEAGAPTSVLVLADGRTLVAAPSHARPNPAFDVAALDADGAPDPSFHSGGRITELGSFQTPARLAAGLGGRLVAAAGDTAVGLFARNFILDPGITLDDGGPYPAAVDEGTALPVSAAATYANGTITDYEWDAGSYHYNGVQFMPDARGANTTVTFPDDTAPHNLTLRVTTSDGLTVIRELPVAVRNAPPSLAAVSVPAIAPLGASVSVTGIATDAGSDPLAVTVDYGDGTAPVPASVQPDGRFTLMRAYGRRGPFRVTISAADDDGGSTTVQRDIVIGDVVGNVFRDTDDDGRRATNDEPVAGATVYVDIDGDGTLDAGEPRTQTGANGQYYFLDLENGTYVVRLDTPAGFRATIAPGQTGPVVVDDDGPGARRDFGLTNRARVAGLVFDDANANAARDAGEFLLQEVAPTVYLDLNNDGWRDTAEPVASVAASGGYEFLNLASGTYTVRLNSAGGALLRERAQTFPFERGDQTGHIVTVAAAEVSQGNDFGSFFGNTPATGVAYNDRNGNGTRESATEPVLVRVVYLDFDNDGVLDPDEARVRTANAGGGPANYLMPLVRNRSYTLRTVVPAGWTQTEPAGGAPYVFTVNPQNTVVLQGLDFGTQRTGPAAVVGRHLFYYRSASGGTLISHTENDRVVATDKAALLPGQQAGFANVSTYSRGINGLMIDLNDLVPSGSVAQGFRFEVGDGRSGVWTALPSAAQVAVRRGAGVNGTDRVVVVFADGAVRNRWLRVTVLPGPITGLAAPDVFYFGSLAGETGNGTRWAKVDALDLALVRSSFGSAAARPSIARFDFNRDGSVNAVDVGIVRANHGRSLPLFSALPTATAAGAPGFAAAEIAPRKRTGYVTASSLLS